MSLRVYLEQKIIYTFLQMNDEQNDEEDADLPFFQKVENNICVEIPMQLQKILEINGYDNFYMLSTLNENVLQQIETFLREDLCDVIDPENQKQIYGLFHNKPKNFKFLTSHRNFLIKLPELLAKAKASCITKMHYSRRDSLIKHNKKTLGNRARNTINVPQISNLTEENALVWTNLKKWAKSKTPKSIWDNVSHRFDDVIVTCSVKSDGGIGCDVACFCGALCKLQKISKDSSRPKRWIHSNYHKHWLKTHTEIPSKTVA